MIFTVQASLSTAALGVGTAPAKVVATATVAMVARMPPGTKISRLAADQSAPAMPCPCMSVPVLLLRDWWHIFAGAGSMVGAGRGRFNILCLRLRNVVRPMPHKALYDKRI